MRRLSLLAVAAARLLAAAPARADVLPAQTILPPGQSGFVSLTGVASGKLLEIAGAATGNGGVVDIWPSNNNNCQKWTIKPSADGYFKVLNVNSGKSLDVQNNGTADGTAILQYTDIGASNQQWLMPIMP